MPLRDYCNPDAILCSLDAADKEDALRQLVDSMARAKMIVKTRANSILEEVIGRERQASTGIGGGIGVPHARSGHVKKMAMAVARVPTGLDFDAIDGELVSVILLLVSPEGSAEEHLKAMRSIVSLARDRYNLKRLQGCRSPQSFIDLFEEIDG